MTRTRSDSSSTAAARLITAGAGLVADGGVKALTTRAAAQAAGTSASAVTVALGGRQGLLVAVFDDARAQAQANDAAALADLDDLALQPELMGDWLSAYLSLQARDARRLILLRREMYLQSDRMPELLPIARLWREQDLAFARNVLARFGQDADKAVVLVEGLHALVELFPSAKRAISRTAWAEQVIRHFCARLCNTPPPSAPWRPLIETRAREMAASFHDEAVLPAQAELILKAAVRLLARVGAAGLSHRQLALEAGVPLSATTYHFKNREAILEGAFKRVYAGLAAEARDITPGPATITLEEFMEGACKLYLTDEGGLTEPVSVMDELLAAAFRDPELEPFAVHILSSRGETSAVILPSLEGVTLDSWAREDAFLFSLLSLSTVSALRVLPIEARRSAVRAFYSDRSQALLRWVKA